MNKLGPYASDWRLKRPSADRKEKRQPLGRTSSADHETGELGKVSPVPLPRRVFYAPDPGQEDRNGVSATAARSSFCRRKHRNSRVELGGSESKAPEVENLGTEVRISGEGRRRVAILSPLTHLVPERNRRYSDFLGEGWVEAECSQDEEGEEGEDDESGSDAEGKTVEANAREDDSAQVAKTSRLRQFRGELAEAQRRL